MKQLFDNIKFRNNSLPQELQPLRYDLESVFNKNILSAGVGRPGYFSDFLPILQRNSFINNFHISEEEHTDNNILYKIPIIDVTFSPTGQNYRIFLLPS